MRSTLAIFSVLVGTSHALVFGDPPCCFGITAYGGPGGPVRQLSDGQNRIGDGRLPTGQYCISNTALKDSQSRGCILTPPTTQWQCDAGVSGTPGFSISGNGTLSYHNSTTFFSCPTEDHGGWNIYSQTLTGEPSCVPVWLLADNCHAPAPPSIPPPTKPSSGGPPPPQSTTPVPSSPSSAPSSSSSHLPPPKSSISAQNPWSSAPTPPSKSTSPVQTSSTVSPPPVKSACPRDLPSNFEFPHLIVPVDSAHPNKAFGTSLNGTADHSMSSVFNFDIPASLAGKQCELVFTWPEQSQLETSAYHIEGSGYLQFGLLKSPATKSTTYANMPAVAQDLGEFAMAVGKAQTISKGLCPAGETVGVLMSPKNTTAFTYFQDSNPCPIGLYIIPDA